MIYDIRHVTLYDYESPVTAAQCTLRLTPPGSADQQVLWSAIEVTPTATRHERTGFFGARALTLAINTRHRKLRIEARARVGVNRRVRAAIGEGLPWETVREEALEVRSLAPASPAHFLFGSALIAQAEPIAAYARESFRPGRGIVASTLDLTRRIYADFAYDRTATEVTTSVAEAYERRRGVCQDFANVMISGLRGLGLPAAYVSGYIHTVPPPGAERLEGADATHAWVEVWCGARTGWIGFDPTNGILVEDKHVVLAVGRDYADISPVHGIFLGSGAHSLKVQVDVVPVL